MQTSGFELFDHTADLGIRAIGRSLLEVFTGCRLGLYAAIGQPLATGEPDEDSPKELSYRSDDGAIVLRDYLADVLFMLSERGLLIVKEERVALFPDRGEIVCAVSPLDATASKLMREVKAITYHELSLVQDGELWRAQFIVDI